MRWRIAAIGDKRTRVDFAVFPVRVDGDTTMVWWEWYKIEEEYREYGINRICRGWVPLNLMSLYTGSHRP